jgi:hypothetical protein
MTEAFDSERSTVDDEVRLLKDARLFVRHGHRRPGGLHSGEPIGAADDHEIEN